MPSQISDEEFRNLHGWPGTCVVVDVEATTNASVALTAGKTYWASCPIGVHLEFGTTPEAVVATSFYLAPGVLFPFTVPNVGGKVAVIKHDTGDDDDVLYLLPDTGTGV